jgi:hypothetical protein
MKRIGRRPFLLSGLALAACVGRTADDSTFLHEEGPKPAPTPSPIPDPPDFTEAHNSHGSCVDKNPSEPVRALHGVGVVPPFPTVLHSFTSDEQARALRADAPLFTKSTTDSGHRGLLFDVLAQRASGGDAIAAQLAGPRFELGRFAWPFLAGVRVSPERYGDQILAIELRPEALYATFDARFEPIRFYDRKGTLVPSETAMQTPERIGAFVFFANRNTQFDTGGGPYCSYENREGLIYRELYLGNPAMVSRFSLGTPEILAQLDGEIADLRAFAEAYDCKQGVNLPTCTDLLRYWRQFSDIQKPDRADRILASMAFANPFGRPGFLPQDFQRLADDLQTLRFVPDPFVVTL